MNPLAGSKEFCMPRTTNPETSVFPGFRILMTFVAGSDDMLMRKVQ